MYLNTDLDLVSTQDLSALVAFLDARGVFPLHAGRADDGLWRARLETADNYADPEANIAAMAAIVESLPEAHRRTWLACSRRDFNIGYDCSSESHAFHVCLSTELLARIVSLESAVVFTVYSRSSPSSPAPARPRP